MGSYNKRVGFHLFLEFIATDQQASDFHVTKLRIIESLKQDIPTFL